MQKSNDAPTQRQLAGAILFPFPAPASAATNRLMSSSSGVPESWISSFCSLLGHEYFAECSEDFIEDDFNLTGLANQVTMYKEALEVRSTPPCHTPGLTSPPYPSKHPAQS